MASDLRTLDRMIDVSFNNPPEYGYKSLPLTTKGSTAASAVLASLTPQFGIELTTLYVYPAVISSGTLKVDVFVDGVSVMSTKATSTVAFTAGTPGVFSTTRVAAGAVLKVLLTSDSNTVTDVFGELIYRPLFGNERGT